MFREALIYYLDSVPGVEDSLQLNRFGRNMRCSPEDMELAASEWVTWRGGVSCTNRDLTCSTYCGGSTSFRFLAGDSLRGSRNSARRHVTSDCCRSSTWCHNVRTSHLRRRPTYQSTDLEHTYGLACLEYAGRVTCDTTLSTIS